MKSATLRSCFFTPLLLLSTFLVSTAPPAIAADGWLTDFDEAVAKSRKLNRPLLVDFSGSDWCGWCIKLDKEVFSQTAFREWARDNVVRCLLDFPRRERKNDISATQKQKNAAVAKRFSVRGYPTVLLLSPDGRVLARTGYRAGGPTVYIAHLEALLAHGKTSIRRLEMSEALSPRTRAHLAAKLLQDCPSAAGDYATLLAETVFVGDKDNETGQRPHAAYLLTSREHPQARAAETYLATTAGSDPGKYYLELLVRRSTTDFYSLIRTVKKYERKALVSKEVRTTAQQLSNLLQQTLSLATGDRAAALFLKLAVAHACLNDKERALRTLARAEAGGADRSQVSEYREYIETLQ